MKTPKPWGQPIDISPPPICRVCDGAAKKPKAS
jgi:hypothetical protein